MRGKFDKFALYKKRIKVGLRHRRAVNHARIHRISCGEYRCVAAKKPYLEELKRGQGDTVEDKRYRSFLPLMSDPLPYGIAANRASIEALVTYSLQQELIPARPQLSQVFVEIDPSP